MKSYKKFKEYILENTESNRDLKLTIRDIENLSPEERNQYTRALEIKEKNATTGHEAGLTKEFIKVAETLNDRNANKAEVNIIFNEFEKSLNNISKTPENKIKQIDSQTDLKIKPKLTRKEELDKRSQEANLAAKRNRRRGIKRNPVNDEKELTIQSNRKTFPAKVSTLVRKTSDVMKKFMPNTISRKNANNVI